MMVNSTTQTDPCSSAVNSCAQPDGGSKGQLIRYTMQYNRALMF